MTGRGAPDPASAAGPTRRSRWLRSAGGLMVVNLAVGMCFSVVLLRHQADDRRTVEVLITRLDAQANAEIAAIWQAVAQPAAAAGALPDAADAVQRTAADVRRSGDPTTLAPVLDALRVYQAATGQVRAALAAGRRDQARSIATDDVVPAMRHLDAMTARAVDEHQAASRRAGRTADVETVLMMLFAAVMAGLMFRRFDWARRSADLRAAQERPQRSPVPGPGPPLDRPHHGDRGRHDDPLSDPVAPAGPRVRAVGAGRHPDGRPGPSRRPAPPPDPRDVAATEA